MLVSVGQARQVRFRAEIGPCREQTWTSEVTGRVGVWLRAWRERAQLLEADLTGPCPVSSGKGLTAQDPFCQMETRTPAPWGGPGDSM